MSRPKGSVDKQPRKPRLSERVMADGVYGDSESSLKANNQILKAKGLRKCNICRKIGKLSDFRLIRYRRSSPTNDEIVPVYSMICKECELLVAWKQDVARQRT